MHCWLIQTDNVITHQIRTTAQCNIIVLFCCKQATFLYCSGSSAELRLWALSINLHPHSSTYTERFNFTYWDTIRYLTDMNKWPVISVDSAESRLHSALSLLQVIAMQWPNYTVSQKTSPFLFLWYRQISSDSAIFGGRNIPQEIWNKHMYTPNSYLVLYVRIVPSKN